MVHASGRHEPADPRPGARRPARMSPALDDAARLAVIGLFVLGLMVALRAAAEILVPLAAALVVAFVLNPAAARLERRGIPGFAVAGIFLLAIAAAIYVLTYLFSLPLQQWVQRLPALVSALYGEAMHLRASFLHLPPDADIAGAGRSNSSISSPAAASCQRGSTAPSSSGNSRCLRWRCCS